MRYKYSQNLTEASEMTFAENEYQGIEQNGTMKRIPTTKVKQGVHNATHDHVDFATNPVADTNTIGRLIWNDEAKTLSIVRDNTGGTKVSVEIGDDIQRRVKNTTGATILNGQPVCTTSALGNTPLIALADGGDPSKNRVTGIMTADIANNGTSYLTTVGLVRNVPIANIIDPADVSWTVGTYLYLSTVTGKLTKNRPSVDIAVRVGIITDISGSNCTILVYLRDDYAKIFDDIDNAITALKGTGYTEGSLKTHEDRLDTLEGADTVVGSVAKTVKDGIATVTDQSVKTASTPSFNGIKFPPTQVPSADPNTLDDYEEGTWTPVLTRSNTPSGHTYTKQNGRYVKIGNQVTVWFDITVSAKTAEGSGQNRIAGLPFVFGSGLDYYTSGNLGYCSLLTAVSSMNGLPLTSHVHFVLNKTTLSSIVIDWLESGNMIGSITYRV